MIDVVIHHWNFDSPKTGEKVSSVIVFAFRLGQWLVLEAHAD